MAAKKKGGGTTAGPVVRAARQSGKFAPEALRRVPGAAKGGTFMARINRSASTLPPAQGRNLIKAAKRWKRNYNS